jgi:hypothetical protein
MTAGSFLDYADRRIREEKSAPLKQNVTFPEDSPSPSSKK